MTSLLIQTSFVGDVVLSTPLVAALREFGDVDVVATPLGASLLQNNPHVRRLIVYDKRGHDRGAAGLLHLAKQVRADDADSRAYLAQGSIRSALIAVRAGYKMRIGFATSPGRPFYSQRVPFRRDRHHAERLLRLALGDTAEIPRAAWHPRLYPSEADRDAASAVLGGPNEGRPFVALAPGSVWATKRWPYYCELAAALRDENRVVVVGSKDDNGLASAIVGATAGDAIDATGRLTLLGSAALIGLCKAIVTNDSAPLHLASAMNTPTVAVFGPTVPAFGFGPLAETSAVVEHLALECRPCHPHGPQVCPLGHWRCMRDLSVAAVLERLAKIA